MAKIFTNEISSAMTANADGYGKWANLPISNDKGFDHLLYPMLMAVFFAGLFE